MNSKQKRIAIRKYKNVLVHTVAPMLREVADLLASGETARAEQELREAANQIEKELR